jgi:hypothetical protein
MRSGKYLGYIKNSVYSVGANTKNRALSTARFLNVKGRVILTEIGYDQIITATSFVEYIYQKYGYSKSCVWYNLKKLKKVNVVDFSEKVDNMPKPLSLTKSGVNTLRHIYNVGNMAKDTMSRLDGQRSAGSGDRVGMHNLMEVRHMRSHMQSR